MKRRSQQTWFPSFTKNGELSLSFTFFSGDEVRVLKDVDSPFEVETMIWEKDNEETFSRILTKEFSLGRDEPICLRSTFIASTTYCLKMRIVHQEMSTQWSDEIEFATPRYNELCIWKECPGNVKAKRKYSLGEKNSRIATKIGDDEWCTIIGDIALPENKVTSWSIKIQNSRDNDGRCLWIGVVPSDINQNGNRNHKECGWYLGCYDSTLFSGPPHNYKNKEYGSREESGEYVHTGDIVGVVMDTTKGELSFVVSGVNLDVAYKGIPLDKPLVPCVLLGIGGDSVELVI